MSDKRGHRDDDEPQRSWWGRWLVAAVVIGSAVGVATRWRDEWPHAVEALGKHEWGELFAVAAFIPAVLVTAPVSWLTVLMGFVFGFVPGAVIGSSGGLLGAIAAFGVSRYFLKSEVRRWWSHTRLFRALERELGTRGVRLIVLARISPVVSCSLLSYLCGATRLSLGRFVWATWLGMAPGAIVYAWIGSTLRDWSAADASVTGHPYARALWIGGLIATLGLLVQLTRTARGMLAQQLADDA